MKKREWFPYLVYGVLAVAILGPLLKPAYILSLDTAYGFFENIEFHIYGYSEVWLSTTRLPFHALMDVFGGVLPRWLIQKVVYFAIFFLCGVGAHRIAPLKGVGSYFTGILYMVNPFTYVRFMAGQWTVLFAYAVLPFAIKAYLNLLTDMAEPPAGSQHHHTMLAVKVALLATLTGMMQIHGLVLLLFAYLIITVVFLATHRRLVTLKNSAVFLGLSALFFIILNLYWILPILTAPETIMGSISKADLLSFAPRSVSNAGVLYDVLSMYGFWRGGYVFVGDIFPLWWLVFLVILYLVVYGFICYFRSRHLGWQVLAFAAVGSLSFLFAVGMVNDITRLMFEVAYRSIPWLSGFRDSQKFVGLLGLAYAFLGGMGVAYLAGILSRLHRRWPKTAMTIGLCVAIALPLAYTYPVFGFNGQLKVTGFPAEWHHVNDYLKRDNGDYNVLFLPWHMYMDYSWLPNTDKRLGDLPRLFFNKPIIGGDDIEVGSLYSQSPNPISAYVAFLLEKKQDISNLGELLAPLNVKYVILVTEADYQQYNFLYQQTDLEVVLAEPGITLFKNTHKTARAYAAGDIVYIRDLEEYLTLSQSQNVTEHIYVLGEGILTGDPGNEPLGVIYEGLARFLVDGTTLPYSVFTLPQHASTYDWTYNGRPSLRNLGFIPVFTAEEGGGEVVYNRFYRVMLPSYIISTLCLVLLLAYFVWGRVTARRISSPDEVPGKAL